MNWSIKCAVLIAALAVPNLTAQSYSILHSFGDDADFYPEAPLVQGPDGTLYGTTSGCALFQGCQGAVFKIQPNGAGFVALKLFTNIVERAGAETGLTSS